MRATIQGFRQIRAHMPPLPTSNAVSLASCRQAANRRRPTDRRGVIACLERTQPQLMFRQGKPLPSSPRPSLCGDKRRKGPAKQGLSWENFQNIGARWALNPCKNEATSHATAGGKA